MRLRQGLTLIELLISSTLLLIILGVLATVLVPAARGWTRTRNRSSANESATIVVARVRAEMRAAKPDAIQAVNNGSGLVLTSWEGQLAGLQWASNGNVLWQSQVAIYLDSSSQVRYQRLSPPPFPTDDPPALTPTSFTASPTDGVLARGIDTISFAVLSGGVVQVDVGASSDGQTCHLEGTASITGATGSAPGASP